MPLIADIYIYIFCRNKRNGLINIRNISYPWKCEVRILLLLFPDRYRFKAKEDYGKNVGNYWQDRGIRITRES